MEEMYEVLKFIEYGTNCRQSLDCITGTLLMDFLRDHPAVEKQMLFRWFVQIGTEMEQYRKCRNGRCYRYLNPYSIVVAEDRRLYLLDPDTPENGFVMKKLQKRAVKAHFVRNPAEGHGRTDDLYGFGRIIQFMLAYLDVSPPLTVREKVSLTRVAGRCTSDMGRKYREIRQALRELPAIPRETRKKKKNGRRVVLPVGLAVAAAVLCAGAVLRRTELFHETEEDGMLQEENVYQDKNILDDRDMVQTGEMPGNSSAEAADAAEMAEVILESYLLENTTEGNQDAILRGEEIEIKVLQALSQAYEREGMITETVLALDRLIEIEDHPEVLQQVGSRKMELEAEQEQYAQAVMTGEKILEKAGNLDTIEKKMEIYRAEADEQRMVTDIEMSDGEEDGTGQNGQEEQSSQE